MTEPLRAYAAATVAVIGGGPAGLMAAERLSAAGCRVTVYDRMPSVGRKFLMAGRGGLNLTHGEPLDTFITRYSAASGWLGAIVADFSPDALRDWCESLGQPVFQGSSGRIFPTAMKASPLLRAWLARLTAAGVTFALRHRWTGWESDGALRFDHDGKAVTVRADATVLALGGASWPRLGSDGAWASAVQARGVGVADLRPANCGFHVVWSDLFRDRFAGQPLKPVTLSYAGDTRQGEIMVTRDGVEGGLIYAFAAALREAIGATGACTVALDLKPGMDTVTVAERLSRPRGSQSVASWLRKALALEPLAIALLREGQPDHRVPEEPADLTALIKAVPLRLTGTAGLTRAISTAGGVMAEDCNASLMLKTVPGTFVAGEMLDWEAPTGGYLLQACFSTAVRAADGVLRYLAADASSRPADPGF